MPTLPCLPSHRLPLSSHHPSLQDWRSLLKVLLVHTILQSAAQITFPKCGSGLFIPCLRCVEFFMFRRQKPELLSTVLRDKVPEPDICRVKHQHLLLSVRTSTSCPDPVSSSHLFAIHLSSFLLRPFLGTI